MIEWLTDRVDSRRGASTSESFALVIDQAMLVDTGLNDSAVRKVCEHLATKGERLSTIMTTHSSRRPLRWQRVRCSEDRCAGVCAILG